MAPSNSYRRRQPAAVVVSAGNVVVTPGSVVPSAGSVGSVGSALSQAATANARVIAAAIVFVLRSLRSICPPFQGHVSPGPPDAHATSRVITHGPRDLNQFFQVFSGPLGHRGVQSGSRLQPMSTSSRAAPSRALWIALLLGGAVAIAVGVYGSVHEPAGQQTISLFFSNTLSFKAWTTSLILFFAFGQLYSALRIWGKVKIPKTMPSWWGDLHRLSGTLAFALSLPVAFHCLWALGFEPDFTELRRFSHSVLAASSTAPLPPR